MLVPHQQVSVPRRRAAARRLREAVEMARPIGVLKLTERDERELQRRIRENHTSKREHLRAQIVLLRAEGMRQQDVADRLRVTIATVNRWSQRFRREGLRGLQDRPGRGRKPRLEVAVVQEVLARGTRVLPGSRRASTRQTAKALGISAATVQRIWKQNALKPSGNDVQVAQRQGHRSKVSGKGIGLSIAHSPQTARAGKKYKRQEPDTLLS